MLDPRSAEAALDRWCEDVRSICGRVQTRPRRARRFTGNIEARSALGLEYASIESNARSLFRNGADVAADAPLSRRATRAHWAQGSPQLSGSK